MAAAEVGTVSAAEVGPVSAAEVGTGSAAVGVEVVVGVVAVGVVAGAAQT